MNLCFDIYHEDDKVGHIEILNDKLIKNEVYTENPLLTLFPASTPLFNILSILDDRVIGADRYTPEIAKLFKIPEYNKYKLLRLTHGTNVDDFIWLKFKEDEPSLTWKEIRNAQLRIR